MRTSIVYGPEYRHRGRTRHDVNEREPEYGVHARARFIPAHVATWSTFNGEERSEKKPDRILLGNSHFALKRGAAEGFRGYKAPRVIPAEYVERIHKIDESIRRLIQHRNELIQEAALRGRPLRREDCEE